MPTWIRKPLIVLGVISAAVAVGSGTYGISHAVVSGKEAASRRLYKDVVQRLNTVCHSKEDKEIVRQFKASHWPDEGDVAKVIVS